MVGVEQAIVTALAGDDVSQTILSGSNTTVIKVTDASDFKAFDVVNLTGTGATIANHRAVRTVASTDTSANTITVGPALSIAPAAGDVIGRGVVQWLYTGDEESIYYARWPDEIPALEILAADAESRCILSYGPVGTPQSRLLRFDPRYEVRAYSLNGDWAQGCAFAVHRLMNGNRAALSVPGATVHRLRAAEVRPQFDERDDRAHQWVTVLEIGVARAVA